MAIVIDIQILFEKYLCLHYSYTFNIFPQEYITGSRAVAGTATSNQRCPLMNQKTFQVIIVPQDDCHEFELSKCKTCTLTDIAMTS